jgi:hypothetical protein
MQILGRRVCFEYSRWFRAVSHFATRSLSIYISENLVDPDDNKMDKTWTGTIRQIIVGKFPTQGRKPA